MIAIVLLKFMLELNRKSRLGRNVNENVWEICWEKWLQMFYNWPSKGEEAYKKYHILISFKS